MKVKNDFVTNSSSVSFCMWGTSLLIYKLPEETIRSIYENYLLSNRSNDNKPTFDEFKESGNIINEFENMCELYGLKCIVSPHSEVAYIEREISSMKDDETYLDFKKYVEDTFKIIGFNFNPELIEGTWFDG